MRHVASALGGVIALLSAAPALAQTPTKLPPLVIDVRWATASIGQDPQTALDLHIAEASLKKRATALVIAAHTYPIRWHGYAIGVGEDIVLAHATTKSVTDSNSVTGDITRHIRGFATIVSLNFGGRDGWSYLGGGVGPMRFDTGNTAIAHTALPFRLTKNFGGGARWFTNQHLAVSFDIRAYFTPAVATSPTAPGKVKSRVLMLSVGVSLR